MTDEQRLERERGNIRDGYASLHSAQLGAQFVLAQLDAARQQADIHEACARSYEHKSPFCEHENRFGFTDDVGKTGYCALCKLAAAEQREAYACEQLARYHKLEKAAEQREEQLREALRFVKDFFDTLESGLGSDDPLTVMRRKFHAPIHAKIDAALATKEQTDA